MLTQIQTTEWQAALLAACPRPRASAIVASSCVIAASVITDSMSTNPVPVKSVPVNSAPVNPASAGAAGYAVFVPRPMAAVRMDAAVRRDGEGFFGLNLDRENGTTSSKQQDQKHLTARRGPVTWRPPH